jgi:RNA polymerase sigma factor (sigma-70 family)
MADLLPSFSDDQLRQLQAEVDRLPALERRAFLLASRDRLTSHQIAERLDVSPRRARRLIARALARLDARLSP